MNEKLDAALTLMTERFDVVPSAIVISKRDWAVAFGWMKTDWPQNTTYLFQGIRVEVDPSLNAGRFRFRLKPANLGAQR